jgi:hypothetical protein
VRILFLTSLLLICALSAACAGVRRNEVYRPLALSSSETGGLLGQTKNASWELELAGVTMRVAPVVLSSKDTWVIGPLLAFPTWWEEEVGREGLLRISLAVVATSEAVVSFDFSEFIVALEDGRVLAPREAGRWIVDGSEAEPVGPITLRGGQAWRGFVEYELPLADLSPFVLRLATLSVGDDARRLPELSFVRDRMYSSS